MGDARYAVESTMHKGVRGVQYLFQRLTPAQKMVSDATDYKIKWGPENTEMDKISELTYRHKEFDEVMKQIWLNLDNAGTKHWRHLYKTLLLIQHLVTHGSQKCVDDVQRNVHRIRTLSTYTYKDKQGNDQGANVRKRAQQVVDFLEDPDLEVERKKEQEQKSRYTSISSSGGYGSGSRGSGGYSGSTRPSHTTSTQGRGESFADPTPTERPPAPTNVYTQQLPATQPPPMQAAPPPQPVQPAPVQQSNPWGETFHPQPPVAQPVPVQQSTAPAPLIDLFGPTSSGPTQPAPAQYQAPPPQPVRPDAAASLLDLFGSGGTQQPAPQPTGGWGQPQPPPQSGGFDAWGQPTAQPPHQYHTPQQAQYAPQPLQRNANASPIQGLF